MTDRVKMKQIVEGALLAAHQPLSIERLMRLFEGDKPSRADLEALLRSIADDCAGRGFELHRFASGFRFRVREELATWMNRLREERPPRFSRALLETLSIIAYRQPISRAEIEEIRGVSVSTGIMRTLLERDWVRIVAHRESPGRPAVYGTTSAFLDYFNLAGLDELPTLMEVRDLSRVRGGPEHEPVETEPEEEQAVDTKRAAIPGVEEEVHEAAWADQETVLRAVDDRVRKVKQNLEGFVRQQGGSTPGGAEESEQGDTLSQEEVQQDQQRPRQEQGTGIRG